MTSPLRFALKTMVLTGIILAAHYARAEEFTIQIGATVGDGVPGVGAGRIENVASTDVYHFDGLAGQNVFFEELAVAPAFGGYLRWQLKTPGGQVAFNEYFAGNNAVGRFTLPETGAYVLTFYVSDPAASRIGGYSFRLRPIPADPTFAIHIGDVVADGQPAGAGNLEVPGARDLYTFTGQAGQNVFFEELAVAPAFGGYLKWQLKTPGGQDLFSGYFSGNNAVGKQVLPESGTYSLEFLVAANNVDYLGTYSFRIKALDADQQFAIQIGDTIADGVPAPGAGNIEMTGVRDIYTFTGLAGQNVFFEERTVAPAFAGYLRWQLTTPGGQVVFNEYFDGVNQLARQTLPETGTYTLTFNVAAADVSYVGTYSFRLYSQVHARGDSLATPPGKALAVPFPVFLCNDTCEAGDVMTIGLLAANSANGGTVSKTTTEIVYTPKTGFLGEDTFTYLLQGQFGGQDVATVKVTVLPQADQYPVVVSLFPIGNSTTEVCLFDKVGPTCVIEASPEFKNWTRIATNAIDGNGLVHFEVVPAKTGMKYFRFQRQ